MKHIIRWDLKVNKKKLSPVQFELLTEDECRELHYFGKFETKTSNWIKLRMRLENWEVLSLLISNHRTMLPEGFGVNLNIYDNFD